MTRAIRYAALAWLRFAAVSAVVVAQPLFDLLRRNPEFFVAHEAGRTEILLVVTGLILIIPSLLAMIVLAGGLAGSRAQDVIESGILGGLAGLLTLQITKHAGIERAVIAIPMACAGCLASALVHNRSKSLRSFLTFASIAAVVLPLAFLVHPSMRGLVFAPTTPVGNRTRFVERAALEGTAVPVVLVILDELPLASLLDQERKIDPELYPSFAALARDGMQFRNATTVSDFTQWAVPAILTGRYPRADAAPNAADHPESLFTYLAGTYRFHVAETITRLCPPDLCPPRRGPLSSRVMLLASDLRYIYLHVVLTDDLKTNLPSLTGDWYNFGNLGEARRRGTKELITRRPGVVNHLIGQAFLNEISPQTKQPPFLFLHTLLEHFPHVSLPTGQFNATRADVPGLASLEQWGDDQWAVAQLYQRHLIQLSFVDAFLGSLIGRLKAAELYDRALVIVTSDHGASFQPRTWRRRYSDETAAEIMRVPLILKLPAGAPVPGSAWSDVGGQRISDRNVQTIDIAPTLAQVIGIPLPWHADGVSLLDQSQPERPSKTIFYEGAETSRTFDRNGPDLTPVLARKMRLFGRPHNAHRAPQPGRFAELFGQPVSALRVEAGGGSVKIDHLSEFQAFRQSPDSMPFDVAGRFEHAHGRGGPTYLAVAVNGVIWAVSQTWKSDPRAWQATPPPFVWVEGRNDLQVFVVAEDDGGPVLRRTTVKAQP